MSSIRFAAALGISIAPITAQATTIVDGSFEAKGSALPVTRYCYDGIATPGGPACAASPWHGGVIRSGESAWGGPVAPDGIYLAFVQGTGTVSQSFIATGSSDFRATWFDENRSGIGGIQTYTVTIDDGTAMTVLGTYTSGIGAFVARTSAHFATTAGRTYTLSFNGQATSDSTSFIDNVALVPEPASWALLLTGFGLTGFAMRRRAATAA